MLVMLENDSRVHQAELEIREGKEREKMSSFSILRDRYRPFARFVRSLSFPSRF